MSRLQEILANAERAQASLKMQKVEAVTARRTADSVRRLREVFPDGFAHMPRGLQFKIENGEATSASVFPAPSAGQGKNLFINVQGDILGRDGQTRRVQETYTVTIDGGIMPPSRPQLRNVNRQQLLSNVLTNCAEIMLKRWRLTSIALNPEGEGSGVQSPAVLPRDVERRSNKDIDMERISLLARQEGVLARVVNRVRGFEGYRLYLFETFCVMECDYSGNAAYVIGLSHFNKRSSQVGAIVQP